MEICKITFFEAILESLYIIKDIKQTVLFQRGKLMEKQRLLFILPSNAMAKEHYSNTHMILGFFTYQSPLNFKVRRSLWP